VKYILLLCALGFNALVGAKAPELYRCEQNNGTVVIQDRRCMITDLQQNKAQKSQRRVLSKRVISNKKAHSTQATNPSQRPNRSNTTKSRQNSSRSPYFNMGWDQFIPINWMMHKIITSKYQQLLLSRMQFKNSNDFSQGVKLTVYNNTMQESRLDAFAQALKLYHQIRDNSSFKLLGSQFKTHANYKAFNIKYQNQRQQLLLTEFYIDEDYNDLFVITVQAKEADWSLNWQLAMKIISQL